jgi:hypothetical protein
LTVVEVYSEKESWAAFLLLVDSHEDSMTLAGIVHVKKVARGSDSRQQQQHEE